VGGPGVSPRLTTRGPTAGPCKRPWRRHSLSVFKVETPYLPPKKRIATPQHKTNLSVKYATNKHQATAKPRRGCGGLSANRHGGGTCLLGGGGRKANKTPQRNPHRRWTPKTAMSATGTGVYINCHEGGHLCDIRLLPRAQSLGDIIHL
jgi:hypothetical protein